MTRMSARSLHRTVLVLLVLAGALAGGCIQGHRAFRASHAAHNEAIRSRINEELLLNVVRLRYRDAPLFLQVGSVVAQFQFSGSLGGAVSVNESAPDAAGASAGIGRTETPTYTFTPLQDNDFVQRLLRPIDIEVAVLLQRSGWSLDRVLRLTVQNLGGLDNATSASGPTPDRAPAYERFRRASRALRTLQAEGALAIGYESTDATLSPSIPLDAVSGSDLMDAAERGYRFDPADDATGRVALRGSSRSLVLRIAPAAAERPEVRELVGALGLEPGRRRYELVTAEAVPADAPEAAGRRTSVAVSTRSLLGTLFYLSHSVDVPAEHTERGWVTVTRDAAGQPFEWSTLAGDLLRVRASRQRPVEAAVAVRYRDHWFYIDDGDLNSKTTFGLLGYLFSLQSEPSGRSPLLTVTAGS